MNLIRITSSTAEMSIEFLHFDYMVWIHDCELVCALRFEGHRLLEPVRRLNRTAAGRHYSGPEYSRLYTAAHKGPVQRMTSSPAQRNGIPSTQ
jgi:hypothetical protein